MKPFLIAIGLGTGLAAAALLPGFSSPAQAQDWPTRPVTMVIGTASS
jgi:hypothetical protein